MNGVPVSAGTSITAWDGDQQVGSTQSREGGDYTLLINRSSGPITFKIGALVADQTYPNWVSGVITPGFDLTASDSCGQVLDGDQVLNGQWMADCQSAVDGRGYARYYIFSLTEEQEVSITLESDDTDTYLYLREGDARSGTFLHQNDDIESGNTDSQVVATLTARTYTIEATTYSQGQAGSFSLTVSGLGGATTDPAPASTCSDAISADGTFNGQWAAACQSDVQGRGYARYYSFSLDQESEVTIHLQSSVDTYLYLRSGDSHSGASLHQNDDIESGNTNSQIVATLPEGAYTIEATTFAEEQAGTFSLSIAGLNASAGS